MEAWYILCPGGHQNKGWGAGERQIFGRSSANLCLFHLDVLVSSRCARILIASRPERRGGQPCAVKPMWPQPLGGRVSSDWLCAHLDLPLKVITTKVIGSTASLGDQQYLLVIG